MRRDGYEKRILPTFLALALCLSLLPTAALAEGEGIGYLYYDEDSKTMKTGTKADGECTIVNNSDPAETWGNSTGATWYVVPKGTAVTISGRVTLEGETYLILCDGAELTVTDGIVAYGKNLTIYGQSTGNDVGKLTANRASNKGIVTTGKITIDGGVVEATGSDYGIFAFALTVYGGSITANGGTGGIFAGSFTATDGTFNGDVETAGPKKFTGGTFNKKLTFSGSSDTTYIADLLADGHICQSTADIEGGKKKDEYYTLSELKNRKTLSSVRIVECPHSLGEDGNCKYCGKSYKVRIDTTYYIDINEAIAAAGETDTVTLLVDIKNQIENYGDDIDPKKFILDLNGKNFPICR